MYCQKLINLLYKLRVLSNDIIERNKEELTLKSVDKFIDTIFV